MQIKAKLLEYNKGNYQGSDYASIKARSADIAKNRILSYKVDLKRIQDDVEELLDQDVVMEVEVTSGANSSATLRVVSVEAA